MSHVPSLICFGVARKRSFLSPSSAYRSAPFFFPSRFFFLLLFQLTLHGQNLVSSARHPPSRHHALPAAALTPGAAGPCRRHWRSGTWARWARCRRPSQSHCQQLGPLNRQGRQGGQGGRGKQLHARASQVRATDELRFSTSKHSIKPARSVNGSGWTRANHCSIYSRCDPYLVGPAA